MALTEAALICLPSAITEYAFALPAEASATAFIYGSYDGAFIFAEPMLTKAYLASKPTAVATPVKIPAQYAVSGYQPTSYTVSYDAATKEYRVALTGLALR